MRRGSDVTVRFALPGEDGRLYQLRGQVVWIDEKTGKPLEARPMGIRFDEAENDDHQRYRRELPRRIGDGSEN